MDTVRTLHSGKYPNGLALFDAALARAPERAAVRYFDAAISYQHIDIMSDALAVRLAAGGFAAGDRLALYLQNMPHYLIALIAAWKVGGVVVPINPMNREREVSLIFSDSTPKALICLDELYSEVIAQLDTNLVPELVYRVSPLEFQTQNDARLFGHAAGAPSAELTPFAAMLSETPEQVPDAPCYVPEDIALLVYTSGTTGTPKGAMIPHGAFCHNAAGFSEVACLAEGEVSLGVAPLFHITGTVLGVGMSMHVAGTLILNYRFDPDVVLDMVESWRPSFVVAAITAFIALYNHPRSTREQLARLTKIYSGGAPVPPGFVAQFEEKFGHYIHNCYGLTESAAPTHITPLGQRAPVSEADGVLSVGLPAPGVNAFVINDEGHKVRPGTVGELMMAGPMISPSYWNKPQETAASMLPEGFRTGDMASFDDKGWFYLVDRKKDMIISSGYKVWPREVEDVLYTHEAIREAAVVGVPDDYRGETVKAVVSLKPGAQVEADDLIGFCKERMAAYKYPRLVEVIDELPKTPTGKILRRELR